jgi:hypothetical protein
VRKIIFVALVLLIAPAVAPARDAEGRVAQTLDASWACKTERQVLGDAGFIKRYGGKNIRTAESRCQTRRTTQQLTPRAAPLYEKTVGRITTTASSNTMTLAITGTANGRPMSGASSSAITVDLSRSKRSKRGGFCAPAVGSTTLADTVSGTNSLTMQLIGTYCTLGSGSDAPQAFAGTYGVTKGEGAYATSSGAGLAVLAVPGDSMQAKLLASGFFSR